MEKSETGNLLYRELKIDEKILLQWYEENPILVYIEMALIKLLDLGIIAESKYKTYQSKVVPKADILKTLVGYEPGNIMDKNELKECLLEITNGNIAPFCSMTEYKLLMELSEKKNSQLMIAALGVIYMRNFEILSVEETNKYLTKIVEMEK